MDTRLLPTGEPVVVREISETGMRVETAARLDLLACHDFELPLEPGAVPLTVRGQIMHGRFRVAEGEIHYTLGVKFVDLPDHARTVIRRFIRNLQQQTLSIL
jgi:hypothetical protein